ncbi:SIS domain-containing protein [Notoacmeibacter ruber]|uniref:SIS domain-containing protein n=1 Tax=Notoacmeibacter ruber TaxID=2670375 RepID=A0A3L7J8K4_9HYPH|nr:SIS domain-containing protein [Notoacmeibacter ruber]RLQ87003.1 SIS domain-containing protein [Notoacmeibacter ruber]
MNDKAKTGDQIASAIEAAKGRATVKDIYFVACGGSYALMLPNQYIMDRESGEIAGHALNAAEFKARAPKRLGETSIVILCSHSGTTPETVEAARYAREAGALTIALTNDAGSPLDEASEYTIYYEHEPKQISPDHSTAVLTRLTFGILDAREGNENAAKVEEALKALPSIVDAAIKSHDERIATFAESHKREEVIYTMGAGTNYAIAYSYAICIFQEMQWIHSAAIHAGEYFHGPFEITDYDVPFIILKGLGASRPMDERAIAFATQYSDKVTVLDSEELGLGAIDSDVVEYVEHMAFGTLLRVYSDKLAFSRGHPLTVRRYMWQMEY